jgi:hypothetical protein
MAAKPISRGKSKACPERSRMGQKSKCKITVQKSKIPPLAVAPLGGRPAATVYSTVVENSLQIGLFMQNKANLKNSQMDIRLNISRDYEKKSKWTFGENKPNQSQFWSITPPGSGGKSTRTISSAQFSIPISTPFYKLIQLLQH